jgi:hypothetical protein
MSDRLRAALAPLLVGLDADGYDATVRETPSEVHVEIVARSASCADCLTPPSVMVPMITSLLRDAGFQQELVLRYPASASGR